MAETTSTSGTTTTNTTTTTDSAPSETTPSETPATEAKSNTENREFFYPTHLDPMRKIPGTNPYLDDVQRHEAEIHRAKVEKREPDFANAPAVQSTPLLERGVIENTMNIPHGHKADKILPVGK